MAHPVAKAALAGLDEIEWAQFSHGGGVATDLPAHLRGLLEPPDSDEAGEAALFLGTQFVCNQSHFGDAALPAIPFLVRLLSSPGVAKRHSILACLVELLRLSVIPGHDDFPESLKQGCLEAMARQAVTIAGAAKFWKDRAGQCPGKLRSGLGTGLDDALELLSVAFSDLPESNTRTAQERLLAWSDGDLEHLGQRLGEVLEGLEDSAAALNEWDDDEWDWEELPTAEEQRVADHRMQAFAQQRQAARDLLQAERLAELNRQREGMRPIPSALEPLDATYRPVFEKVLKAMLGLESPGGFVSKTADEIEVRWPERGRIELRAMFALVKGVPAAKGMTVCEDVGQSLLSYGLEPNGPPLAVSIPDQKHDRWRPRIPCYAEFLLAVGCFLTERQRLLASLAK